MNFREKIDYIIKALRAKGLHIENIDNLEAQLPIGDNTLRKAYNDNREPRRDTVGKIIGNLGISQTWWQTGEGELFIKNHTLEMISNNNDREPNDARGAVYKEMIDEKGYILVHGEMMKEYKWMPNKVIDLLIQAKDDAVKNVIHETKEQTEKELEEKYRIIIEELKAENNELRKRLPPDEN